jgi:VCBS repeat-containing protein
VGFVALAAHAHAETIIKQSISVKEAGKYDLRVRTQINEPGILRLTIEKPGLDVEQIDFGRVDVVANTPPNAVDDIRRTDEDTVKSANVLNNDSDAENHPLTVTAVNGQTTNGGGAIALSSGATLALNADGAFTYDPNGAFESLNTGATATDTFSYTIADGNGGTATVTMTVDGVTDPFRTRGRQLIGPDGKPIALKGYRVGIGEVSSGFASEAKFKERAANGVGGNAQAFEIWWSNNTGPSEPQPGKVGVYNKDQLGMYLEAMRGAVRAGMYVIPSIRVSFDKSAAEDYLKNDKTGWEGWAPHDYVLYNRADSYGGRGRDRFFAWLDWLIPAILADKEIADKIAYWEMWHFPGHRQPFNDSDWDQYIDDFVPRLIAKFRKHEPERLLGISFRHPNSMSRLLARGVTFNDPNLLYVIGGYCHHDTLMRDGPDRTFPAQCWDGKYTNGEFEFVTYARQKNVAIHSQEGPGLYPTNRTDPISATKRDMLVGLLRLYNAEANGWAFHGFAPDTKLQPGTGLNTILRMAINGSL